MPGSGDVSRKYPRSEWIDQLNGTDLDKIELIEIPKLDFAQLPLTSEITKYLNHADRAMREGRWDDVFGECRKTIDALYHGIDEWGEKLQLSSDEKAAIQNVPTSDKLNAQRNLYFTKLMRHSEKGERLNKLRNSLHKYLSLDPHEPEHKGISFTRDDSVFAIRITSSLCANVVKQLEYNFRSYH